MREVNANLGSGRLALVMTIAGFLSSGAPHSASAACIKMMEAKVQEWTGDIINIVPWVAEAEGIFRKHCVNVKFVPLNSGPAALSASVSGSIQFHNGGPDGILRARAKGLDIRLVANMYGAQWSALVVRNGLDLPHAKEGYPAIMQDFVGKKIGVTVLGGTTEAFVRLPLFQL
jgi:NitT/TauT family transport system substrate-binding protein